MDSNPHPNSTNRRKKKEVLGEVSKESFESAPLMMTADELAETLCISLRQVWRLKAKGDIPKPVNIGRSVRWKRSDILEWIAEGCPSSSGLINTLIYQVFWRPIYSVFLKP
jgi:excisionase family DNA binding protein